MAVEDQEREFLEAVRRFAGIGYGRMLQIIQYEWSEQLPARVAMEIPAKPLPIGNRISVSELLRRKAGDPLAGEWKRFE